MKKLPLWIKIILMVLGGPFTIYYVCFSVLFDAYQDVIDKVKEKINA